MMNKSTNNINSNNAPNSDEKSIDPEVAERDIYPTAKGKDLVKDRVNAFYETPDYSTQEVAFSDASLDRKEMAIRRITMNHQRAVREEMRGKRTDRKRRATEAINTLKEDMLESDLKADVAHAYSESSYEAFFPAEEKANFILNNQEKAAIDFIADGDEFKRAHLNKRAKKVTDSMVANNPEPVDLDDVLDVGQCRKTRDKDREIGNDKEDFPFHIRQVEKIGAATQQLIRDCIEAGVAGDKIELLKKFVEISNRNDKTLGPADSAPEKKFNDDDERPDADLLRELRLAGLNEAYPDIAEDYAKKEKRKQRSKTVAKYVDTISKSWGGGTLAVPASHINNIINVGELTDYEYADKNILKLGGAVNEIKPKTPIFGCRPFVHLLVSPMLDELGDKQPPNPIRAKLLFDSGANCVAFNKSFIQKLEEQLGEPLKTVGKKENKSRMSPPIEESHPAGPKLTTPISSKAFVSGFQATRPLPLSPTQESPLSD